MTELLTPEEAQEAERQTWTEARFTKEVIALAKSCGWRTAHFRPAQTKSGHWITAVQGDGKGFFDLVLVRCQKIIFAELKVKNRRPTTEQIAWISALMDAMATGSRHEVYIWQPEDWEDILATLK